MERMDVEMHEVRDPIHCLPPELVAMIFECGYAMEVPGESPLSLGAVCRLWRAIAWSTPTIWSSISFCINPPGLEDSLQARLRLLGEYIDRSRALPLSLRVFSNDEFGWDQDKDGVRKFADIFHHCHERWWLLDLHLPKAYLQCLNERKPPRSRTLLESLSISMPDGAGEFPEIDFTHSTLDLQNLHLNSRTFDLNSLKATFTQLRKIIAPGSVEAWLSVISSAPLLEEATFIESSSSSTRLFSSGLVHRSLKSLKISFDAFSEKRRLPFHQINCPNLNTFSIKSPSYYFCEDFSLLVDNQGQKLTTLDLWNFYSTPTRLEDLLATLPSLENISIGKPKSISVANLFDLISRRIESHSWSTSGSIQRRSFLPNLHTFHIDVDWFSYDAWPRIRGLSTYQNQLAKSIEAMKMSKHRSDNQPCFTLKKIMVNLRNQENIQTMKDVTCLNQETLDVVLKLREAGVEVSMSVYGINACIEDLIEASTEILKPHYSQSLNATGHGNHNPSCRAVG